VSTARATTPPQMVSFPATLASLVRWAVSLTRRWQAPLLRRRLHRVYTERGIYLLDAETTCSCDQTLDLDACAHGEAAWHSRAPISNARAVETNQRFTQK
jgi:hypothetical protein